MTQSDVGLNLPDLSGFTMHRHVIADVPRAILLSFFKISEDRSQWFETDVFLVNTRMGEAHFEFSNAFPQMTSYRAEDVSATSRMKALHVEFEGGRSVSFYYENAFYVTKVSPGPTAISGNAMPHA